MADDPDSTTTLSIGALSTAVGVPVATLRTWERRYNFPTAIRRPSGHRRFSIETVERLQLVRSLIEQGHKASSVVPASIETLTSLIKATQPVSNTAPLTKDWLDPWVQATLDMNSGTLEWLHQEGWSTMGGIRFMKLRLSPFLQEVGKRWRAGELSVAQEHHASSVTVRFLAMRWQTISNVAIGPRAICATLPNERHEIGLHMAAATLALRGWTIRFLGTDTPVDAIASTYDPTIGAIVIASSDAADPKTTRHDLVNLRTLVGPLAEIWIGGGHPKIPIEIAEFLPDLDQLSVRAQRLKGKPLQA
jgi:methanogenic corrinoid protein MtbC1